MEIVGRRALRLIAVRDLPVSSLSGGPVLTKRCDALCCESAATEHCSAHGVHFCRRHFEAHRADWHENVWETPLRLARC
jgi:hypothetical protein